MSNMLTDFIELEARRRAKDEGLIGTLSTMHAEIFIKAVITDMRINPDKYSSYGNVQEWLSTYDLTPELKVIAKFVMDEAMSRCETMDDGEAVFSPRLSDAAYDIVEEMRQQLDYCCGTVKAVEYFLKLVDISEFDIMVVLSQIDRI